MIHDDANHNESTEVLLTKAAHLEEIEADLQLARELQIALLPQQYPTFPRAVAPEESALRFYHRYIAAGALGGDFFSVLQLSDTTAGVFLCDVMGHGVRPAMVTAMLRSLVDELATEGEHPAHFLSCVNERLTAILRRSGTTIFASAFYMVIDASTGELRYANAGHPAPVHVQRESGVIELIADSDQPSGPALGVFEEATYPVLSCQLKARDVIILYTDGLVEAKGSDARVTVWGEEYGQQRLLSALKQRLGVPARQLLDEVIGECQRFSGDGSFEDDLCMLAMEVCRIGEIVPSVRDDVTGLFNRRYLDESLEREVHRAQRNGYPLGIITLSLDQLEQLSQQKRETSTLLLRRIGEFLNRHTRRSDIACHYDESHFVVVLPEASQENIERKATHFREMVQQISTEVASASAPRVSSAVAVFPDHGTTGNAVLRVATTILSNPVPS